jgi:predicted TIM-barrel fold metal-dependent hydrolase
MSDSTIVDIHCHTAGIGAGGSGCFVSPALRNNWKYQLYLLAFGVTEAELKSHGDGLVIRRISERLAASARVAKAVILAMDGVIDSSGELDERRTEIFVPNAFAAKEVRHYPNLLFGASVNPYRRDALERLDKAAAEGAVLIKWLPSIQNIDPADRRLVPFYRRLATLGLPLLTHTGNEHSFTHAQNALGDPERLRLPLDEGVTVIAAHAASNGRINGEGNHDRFLRLTKSHPNLHADISALTQLNRLGHLERLLRHHELHGRLLYGTDMPIINTGITSPWFHCHRLGHRALRSVLAKNNPWDRDVTLKDALGVTEEILGNSARILGSGKLDPKGIREITMVAVDG